MTLTLTNLVQGTGSSQDDVRVFHLDNPLPQTNKIRSNSNGPTSHLQCHKSTSEEDCRGL